MDRLEGKKLTVWARLKRLAFTDVNAIIRGLNASDLETMERLRRAFDPAGLCNPGKIFPTPRLCGEIPGPYRAHPLELAGLGERF